MNQQTRGHNLFGESIVEKKCLNKMKVLRSRILGTMIIFGEILLVFTTTQRMHEHFHKRHHVHHHDNIHKVKNINRSKRTTEEASELTTPRSFHIYNNEEKASGNVSSMEERISSNNKTLSDNDTRVGHKTKDLKNKGTTKNSNRLKFREKIIPSVRQHAAKSIKLDCHVKGVGKKKHLVIKWFKESEKGLQPIKDIMKGYVIKVVFNGIKNLFSYIYTVVHQSKKI